MNWFWITLWWFICYTIFLSWYIEQIDKGRKEKVTPQVAFLMFILSGLGPFLVIITIVVNALALNNDNDSDK